MKPQFHSAGVKRHISKISSSNFLLMYFRGGFGFTRWKGLPVKSFCSGIMHNMRVHLNFQLHNQLTFINEGVLSKPIDEIPKISSNHTFLSPLFTDLVLLHQFTSQFYYRALAPAVLVTTEPP